MRLRIEKTYLLNESGIRTGLEVKVVNAATGEPVDGLCQAGVTTPLGTAPEFLELRTTMFDFSEREIMVIPQPAAPQSEAAAA